MNGINLLEDTSIQKNTLHKKVAFRINATLTRPATEYDIFVGDGEWMITDYDVVNIYDNYEEFKEFVMRLLINS